MIRNLADRRSLPELKYLAYLALRLLYRRGQATRDETRLMILLEHELGIGEVLVELAA